MKQLTLLFILSLISLLIAGCSDDKPVTDLTKDQSIEIAFDTQNLSDTAVILTTKKNIYLKGALLKTIVDFDTLPFPGFKSEVIEDDNGDSKSVTMPKEYEFFITVK
ncbi:MAG: hypothetical protein WCP69_03805 [Bacteroidota bacterium]